MAKDYTIADWAIYLEMRKENLNNRVISHINKQNKILNSKVYNMASKEKKKEFRSKANTIPLWAFGFDKMKGLKQ